MKVLIYAVLITLLIPVQSILLPHVSVWDVKPDLGFILVCLVGLFDGEMEGLLVGMAVGLAMNLFSAEDLVVGIATKGGLGYAAGLAGRQLVYLSPVILVVGLFAASCVVGVLTAFTLRLSDEHVLRWGIATVVLPEACYNAVIGGALYWALWSRLNIERWVSEYRI